MFGQCGAYVCVIDFLRVGFGLGERCFLGLTRDLHLPGTWRQQKCVCGVLDIQLTCLSLLAFPCLLSF